MEPTWNYLRVRGEYSCGEYLSLSVSELPPRARRIHFHFHLKNITHGTTSACAENTYVMLTSHTRSWNYLRVRGEYGGFGPMASAAVELPPRARRIRLFPQCGGDHHGTTSACAENTHHCQHCSGARRNYLRVRGEYRAASCPTAA